MTSTTRIPMPRIRTLVAAAAALLVSAACAADPDPQFNYTGTGALAGRLFYDADNNGAFTPLGGDTLLTGVKIEVRQRGDTAVVIDSARTDANGEFSFATLPAGTHDVFIVGDASTGALLFCQNPVPTSVYIDEQAFVSAPAKLGCVIRISAAEALVVGAPVTVAGVVTAGQGTYRTANDNIYMQDVTGGIQVFGIPAALALQPGDSIEVTGTLGVFRTELQIVTPTVAPNIVRGGAVPAPKETTAGALGALTATSADVGRLVVVRGVTVGTFASGNAPIADATGASQVRLDGRVASVIPTSTFEAGTCYDITGVAGIFDGAAQLKPRSLADVAEVACTP
jgi:hypothetical protein